MASTTQTTVLEDTPRHLTIEQSVEPHDVNVDIHYTKQPDDGARITIEALHSSDEKFRDIRKTLVKDVRRNVADYTLEKNGFQYVQHEVPQEHLKDDETIKAVHYPEIEAMILRATGAKKVLIYNHIVRNAPLSTDVERMKTYVGPARRAHIDVSTKMARSMAKDMPKNHNRPDMTDDHAGKWQLLNLWRPLKTIRKHPLAVSDSTTIPYTDQHLVQYERVVKAEDKEMKIEVENCFTGASKDGSHQFYYMHEQRPDEVLIFKTADSDDQPKAGAVTHTSFEVPGTEDMPTRESIEIRLMVVY